MSPFCHFRRPNFFPKPEKVSEAWLAVLSMVSWVVLATWSMAGEGRKEQLRAGPRGTTAVQGLASPGAPSPGCSEDRGSAEERVCLDKGWVEYGGVLRLSILLPTRPTRPFCPASVA